MSSGSSSNPTKCYCSVPADLKKSWTPKNPGRRFWTCKFYNADNERLGCDFFEWYDDTMTEWQKNIITNLLREKNQLKRERDEKMSENTQLLIDLERMVERKNNAEPELKKKVKELKCEVQLLRKDNAWLKNIIVGLCIVCLVIVITKVV